MRQTFECRFRLKVLDFDLAAKDSDQLRIFVIHLLIFQPFDFLEFLKNSNGYRRRPILTEEQPIKSLTSHIVHFGAFVPLVHLFYPFPKKTQPKKRKNTTKNKKIEMN